jgi:uncharacterized C2H2 Zn-finger protein
MAVRCATCDQTFESPELLQVHMNDEHDAEGGRSDSEGRNLSTGGTTGTEDAEAVGARFTCPDCGAVLSSHDALEMHRHDAHAVDGTGAVAAS